MTQQNKYSFLNYHPRRQRLGRKFNLNMVWYGTLYRRLNRWERTWTLHHNPLDPKSPESFQDTETFLSFSNPNYQFEDRLNSNVGEEQFTNDNFYDLDIHNLSLSAQKADSVKQRKKYAQLDLSSMGINLSPSDVHSPLLTEKGISPNSEEIISSDDETSGTYEPIDDHDSKKTKDKIPVDINVLAENKPRGFLGYYSLLEAKAREQNNEPPSPEVDEEDSMKVKPAETENITKDEHYEDSRKEINSPDSHDSGIQSDSRSDDDATHAQTKPSDTDHTDNDKKLVVDNSFSTEKSPEDQVEQLPPGWEKHQDEDGPYYWHIKSGTIQRSPPTPAQKETKRSISIASDNSTVSSTSSAPSSPTSVTSNTEEHLQEFEGHALQYAAKSLQSLCSSTEKLPDVKNHDFIGEETTRFAVRSLGWVCIADDDLTPEKSSKAVNKCIVDLSLGKNDINDVVGRWGDGKDLYMDLDTHSLRLIDPQDGTILNMQPIHTIRVWGVGRDNGRDFAYVAIDKLTRKHMCHVFRCDTPARQIANSLRDICKRIMLEQGLQQNSNINRLTRPTDLPNLDKNGQPNGQKLTFQNLYTNASFPTPMEEPKKIIRCHYLGMVEVQRATGMDTLNNAIEGVYSRIPPEQWTFVNVAIAPSTITITEHGKPEKKIEECRVRFLAFMGIAMKNVKLCAFIMHSPEDQFFAHIFHCEPSAGPLCKTIEAACKLRYQKCLDAHPQTPSKQQLQNKGIGATIRAGVQNVFGILKGRRTDHC